MADLWQSLIDAAKADSVITIGVPVTARVQLPKRTKAGRPRTVGPIKFAHYAGYDSDVGGRPRCAFRGCDKWLRKDQRLGCCPAHEEQAAAEARRILRRLENVADDGE